MIKMVCHFKRKPGITLAEMRDLYENGHVPFMLSICPPMADYRRNYRIEGGAFNPFADGASGEPDFDVVTEVWFEDRAQFKAMAEFVSRPDIAPLVIADEERFMDRSASRMMLVDEVRSPRS